LLRWVNIGETPYFLQGIWDSGYSSNRFPGKLSAWMFEGVPQRSKLIIEPLIKSECKQIGYSGQN
jgi:hypothetical protein